MPIDQKPISQSVRKGQTFASQEEVETVIGTELLAGSRGPRASFIGRARTSISVTALASLPEFSSE